jgi:hypothetical protein
MLYKSLKAVIPIAQADEIFDTADGDGSGSLSKQEMQALWVQLGDATATRDVDKRLQKMLNNKSSNTTVSANEEVTRQQFHAWCRNNMPSTIMSLTIFAIQTLSLLLRHNGLFGWANILNLDAETAMGSCLAPTHMLGSSGRIFSTMLAPAIGSITTVAAYLVLKHVKSFSLNMSPHHLSRSFVQLLLLSYAPLTRRATAMLICRPGIDRSYAFFGGWLHEDMSVECFLGEHQGAAYLAVFILFIFGLGLPLFLLVKVRKCLHADQDTLQATQRLKPVCWDILFKTGESGYHYKIWASRYIVSQYFKRDSHLSWYLICALCS